MGREEVWDNERGCTPPKKKEQEMKGTMTRQEPGLFDYQNRMAELSESPHGLEKMDGRIDWEMFLEALDLTCEKPSKGVGGAHWDRVMMFKVWVIIDASFVEVPRQRNSREENAMIKDGAIPIAFGARDGKGDKRKRAELEAGINPAIRVLSKVRKHTPNRFNRPETIKGILKRVIRGARKASPSKTLRHRTRKTGAPH
jgi:hypothetical protein